MLARRIAAVAALPLALAAASGAGAKEIVLVEGCYGAVVVVCDPYVTVDTDDAGSKPVDVCTGSCQTYYVPYPRLSSLAEYCVGFSDRAGNHTEQCVLTRTEQENS